MHENLQASRPILIVFLLWIHDGILLQFIFDFLVILVDSRRLALQSLVHILQIFVLEAIPQVGVQWILKLRQFLLLVRHVRPHEDVLEVLWLALPARLRRIAPPDNLSRLAIRMQRRPLLMQKLPKALDLRIRFGHLLRQGRVLLCVGCF